MVVRIWRILAVKQLEKIAEKPERKPARPSERAYSPQADF